MPEVLAKWLATYRKKNTQTLYRSAARHFFVSVYGGEISRPDENFENLAEKYVSECRAGRDWCNDLLAYAVYLGKGNRPPASAGTYMTCARGFIEFALNIEVSKKQLRQLRGRLPKGKRARTIDGDLSKKRLRQILSHCDAKGSAFFLFLATSGIRKGEALKLLMDDVDLNNLDIDPVKVVVRGEIAKEGDTYFSFISREAAEALKEWLNTRKDYLQSALYRGRGLSKLGNGQGVKDADDRRLFPFSGSVADSMWANAIRKAQLDKRDISTNRYEFHLHMLRKFFQSQMKFAGVPDDLVEALIGHSGYLDGAYRRYSPEQIVEMYKRGEPQLLLNISAETQIIIKSEIDAQRQELADLTRKMTDSNNMMIRLKIEKDDLAKKVESLELMYNKLFEVSPEELRELMQEVSRRAFQRQREEDKNQSASF